MRSDLLRSDLLRSELLRSGLLRSGLLRSGLLCSGLLRSGSHPPDIRVFRVSGGCFMPPEAASVYWCKLNRATGSTFRYNVKRPNPT